MFNENRFPLLSKFFKYNDITKEYFNLSGSERNKLNIEYRQMKDIDFLPFCICLYLRNIHRIEYYNFCSEFREAVVEYNKFNLGE